LSRFINCNSIISVSGTNRNYCNKVVEQIGADKIILTIDNFNKSKVLEKFGSNTDQYAKLDKYLNIIKPGTSGKYRLIVMFDDGSIATALFKF